MDLLPELNTSETAVNVRQFFRKDWPRLVMRSGTTASQLKSPSFDAVPGGPSFENSQENKMMTIFEAQAAVGCVMDTLNSCRSSHKTILEGCYIDGLPNWKVAQKMGYSEAQEQRIKVSACCEFAERLTYFQMRWGTSLPDMQSYKPAQESPR